jgi:hypothetical protein
MIYAVLILLLTTLGIMHEKYKAAKKEENIDKPNFGGEYVDIGFGFKEEWIWVEDGSDLIEKCWISIIKQDGGHLVQITKDPVSNAIEQWDSDSIREIEVAIELFKAGYSVYGEVQVNNEMR